MFHVINGLDFSIEARFDYRSDAVAYAARLNSRIREPRYYVVEAE